MATVSVLVVGGGGSANPTLTYGNNGAGGAGAVIYDPTHSVSVGSYSITVGGAGQSSLFDTIVGGFGGYGGQGSNFNGSPGLSVSNGGSGGGGGGSNNGYPPGNGGTATGGGHAGAGGLTNGAGGGGGGAGSAGGNPTGGAGVSNAISGTSLIYGVGGNANGVAVGVPNSGNGGSSGFTLAELGSTGVVIISYPTGSINATGGTISYVGGNTIHTFNSSGTWTFVNVTYTLTAATGNFTLTGIAAAFKISLRFILQTGYFALTSTSVNFGFHTGWKLKVVVPTVWKIRKGGE